MRRDSPGTQYVLLIAAFERDNFGDILFGVLATRLLAPIPVIWGALMGRDMRGFGGEVVMSLADARPFLQRYPPDAVIHCGGETMSTSTIGGVVMDVSRPLYSMGVDGAWRAVRRLTDRTGRVGYLNAPQDLFPHAATIPPIAYISIGGVPRKDLIPDVVNALSAARFVTVRDPVAGEFASRNGIKARVVPDLVHLIADVFPRQVVQDREIRRMTTLSQGPYLVFQAREEFLNANYDVIAEQLVMCSRNRRLAIVVQPAGTVIGHDNVRRLEELRETLERRGAYGTPALQLDRNVWAQVATIARADLWIGTSLHGQIVSCAYGVPSVGCGSEKVATYFRHWAPLIEAGVEPEALVAAADRTLEKPVSWVLSQNTPLATYVAHSYADLMRAVIPDGPCATASPPYDPVQVMSAELDRLRHLVIDMMIDR